jgi:hypothetical protein
LPAEARVRKVMEGIQAGGLTYRTRKEYATVRRPQNKKII